MIDDGPNADTAPAVRYEVADGVATLTLDQPATRNALTAELVAGLAAGLARAEADLTVRAVVITHTGPAFCAGADLRASANPQAAVGVGSLPAVMESIGRSRLPVIARLSGHAMGGGVGLTAACDISVATHDVRFGFTEVRLGVAPAVISVVCLPKLSRGHALELFLTGERIPAERAERVGLITRAVAPADLDATVRGYLDRLLAGGPGALAVAKALVRNGSGADIDATSTDAVYGELAVLSARLFASEEGLEGRAAFRDKRPAAWVPASSHTESSHTDSSHTGSSNAG